MTVVPEQPFPCPEVAVLDGQPPPAPLRLRLLGTPGLAVRTAGSPAAHLHFREVPLRPMVLCLLAALCLDGPRRRLCVADLLWNAPSARALHNLRTALHGLRLALGPHADALRADGTGLSVDPACFEVDALNLGELRAEALLSAWTGPLLDGHRTGGNEAWLEWVDHHEQRLLHTHLERVRQAARTAPPELAARLLRRVEQLRCTDQVRCVDQADQGRSPSTVTSSELRPVHISPPPLLGRAAELELLHAVRGATLLCGPPGSGRTALAGAAWPDARWLRAGEAAGDFLTGDCFLTGDRRIVVDDLEALDAATLQRCAALVRRAAAGNGPAVLLISGGSQGAEQQTLSFARDLPRLNLGRLGRSDFAALAGQLRPDWATGHTLPPALHAELWALTGGLPGLLSRLLRPEVGPAARPPSLADTVRCRIIELPTDQHAVLAAAHALPGACAWQLRGVLAGALSGRLEDALAGLQARQWWREDRPTHPRLAEWAWAAWPWLGRQELTERAAALDCGSPAHSPEPLRHRQQSSAGLYAAEALSAYHLALTVQAEAAARRSLSVCMTGPAAAQALDVLANLALDGGHLGLARTLAARALGADPAAQAGALYTAAYLADLLGEHVRAERLVRSALPRLSPAESPAPLMAVLASSLDARGRFAEARHWHTLALHSARAQPSPYVLCEVISFMLWHLNATGQPQQAETLGREALDLGPFDNAGYLRNSLGQALLLQGRLDGTLEELGPQLGVPNTTLAAVAHARQALTLHRMGQPEAARTALDHGAALLPLTEAGHPRYAWAVAALTIGPGEFGPQAARTVRGVRTNDYDLVQQFRRMTGRPPGR